MSPVKAPRRGLSPRSSWWWSASHRLRRIDQTSHPSLRDPPLDPTIRPPVEVSMKRLVEVDECHPRYMLGTSHLLTVWMMASKGPCPKIVIIVGPVTGHGSKVPVHLMCYAVMPRNRPMAPFHSTPKPPLHFRHRWDPEVFQ